MTLPKRKRIALHYQVTYSEATSIPLYMQNLIKALNLLDDITKPEIILIYKEGTPINDVKNIGYPYIKYIKEFNDRAFTQKIYHKFNKFFFNTLKWERKYWHPFYPKVDISFPYLYFNDKKYLDKTINWLVDMQQMVYPDFFSENELLSFNESMRILIEMKVELMFSSQDSYKTFQEHYPQAKNPYSILPFSSIVEFQKRPIADILEKYSINQPYFITPNQFWPHKNHLTILKAARLLLQTRDDFQIVFTGKTSSSRNTNIYNELKEYVVVNNLEKHVRFLGFVDRDDLFNLMTYSKSIIQPSLFEGWSTLVEECKALNNYIILSDLAIHREQISENCSFFESLNHQDLATKMNNVLLDSVTLKNSDYTKNIDQFLTDIKFTFRLGGLK